MEKKMWIVWMFLVFSAILYSLVDQHLRLLMPTAAGPWIVMTTLVVAGVAVLVVADMQEWD